MDEGKKKTVWTWDEVKARIKDIIPTPDALEEKPSKARKRGRGYTKPPHNKKKIKMRRKMANESRKINRR